jgi:hypothetical protein
MCQIENTVQRVGNNTSVLASLLFFHFHHPLYFTLSIHIIIRALQDRFCQLTSNKLTYFKVRWHS